MSNDQTVLMIVVIAANTLGIGMLVPQAWRTFRSRNLHGVSAVWIGAGLGINVGWVVYAIAAEVPGLLPVSGGGVVLYGSVALIARTVDNDEFARMGTSALLVIATLGWVTAWSSVEALGLGLAGLYTVQFAPAALASLTNDRLDGISPNTWVMSLGEATLWLVYGLAIADVAVALGGAGAAVMSTIVSVRAIAYARPTPA